MQGGGLKWEQGGAEPPSPLTLTTAAYSPSDKFDIVAHLRVRLIGTRAHCGGQRHRVACHPDDPETLQGRLSLCVCVCVCVAKRGGGDRRTREQLSERRRGTSCVCCISEPLTPVIRNTRSLKSSIRRRSHVPPKPGIFPSRFYDNNNSIDVKKTFLRFLFMARFLRFLTFFIFPTFFSFKNVH